MARPNQSPRRREELVPVLARTFAELGYRRATSAELAQRCGVRENVLYRLWPDKKAMFVAAIDHVYAHSEATWSALLARSDPARGAAELLLDHEAEHHGEHGLYRIVFAGLSETDDPEIAAAMRGLYGRFQRFVRERVAEHRGGAGSADPALLAWAILGLGTVANVGRELELLSAPARKRLLAEVGRALLDAP